MLFPTLARLLVPLFTLFTGDGNVATEGAKPHSTLKFELRHLHATSANNTAHIIFSDVSPRKLGGSRAHPVSSSPTYYTVRTRPVKTYRPPSLEAHAEARERSVRFGQSERLDWEEEESVGPDVESRETLLELAKMTNNAYVVPDDPAWYDSGEWNIVRSHKFYFYFYLKKKSL